MNKMKACIAKVMHLWDRAYPQNARMSARQAGQQLSEETKKLGQQLTEGTKKLEQQLLRMEKELEQSRCRENRLEAQLKSLQHQQTEQQNRFLRTTPQPRLEYFVLNILDHCNLRCKGCDHFAAIAEKRFIEPEVISRDLQRMSELTHGHVTRIGVMGGEPLLHPQLLQIVAETRKWFPETRVQIVSNGLLLNQQNEEFWAVCRENRIEIVVTKYPLQLDFDRMTETAKAQGVAFQFYDKTGEVLKTSTKMTMDPEGMQNPIDSFVHCYHANRLPLLMEGRFYGCPIAANVRHFNKKFGTNMQPEEGDWLDIYSLTDVNELTHFICSPRPFCRYCNTRGRIFGMPWSRSEQKMDEWV